MTVIVRAISDFELSIEVEGRNPAVYDLEAAFARLTLLENLGGTVRYV